MVQEQFMYLHEERGFSVVLLAKCVLPHTMVVVRLHKGNCKIAEGKLCRVGGDLCNHCCMCMAKHWGFSVGMPSLGRTVHGEANAAPYGSEEPSSPRASVDVQERCMPVDEFGTKCPAMNSEPSACHQGLSVRVL